MAILDDVTVEIGCNWKTSVDAFNEAYHIAGTHPDTLDINDDVDVPIDCYDRHTRMILKLGVASPRHPEHGQVTERVREHFLRAAGIDVEHGLEAKAAAALNAPFLWSKVRRNRPFVAMKMEISWRNAPFRNSGFRKLKPFAGHFTHES